ncbi:alpha/beta fold hydrolase [Brevibacterium ihuae]|uniref:alpha/beta fold hydrolase n=1 Tax=Brevibacterium ihuae TaxID=1631743 RepID=UPI0011AFCED5|nr:alpha/beta hydrolase [Brevibacterium ihuae]
MDRSLTMRRRALRVPGLRSIRRPIGPRSAGAEAPATGPGPRAGAPGAPSEQNPHTGPEFDLHYVRTGSSTYRRGSDPVAPASGTAALPLVIIPGGPGLASALPYDQVRRRAAARGLEVVMVEHRGVGLSRRDLDGHDLPQEAMSVELAVADLAAVLDAEGIDRAVIIGSSYGTYVAQAFAVDHPDRVGGLVLDSPMLAESDEKVAREFSRDLLYCGTAGWPETRLLAAKVYDLVDTGVVDELTLGRDVRIIYEFAGPRTLDRFLNQVKAGRAKRTLAFLDKAASGDTGEGLPYYMEFDIVGEIAFRELSFFAAGDGRIFDQTHEFEAIRSKYSDYAGQPYDFPAALPTFDFPVLVLSGERDLRTPRPVAEEIVRLAPRGHLVPLPDSGHSALDTHLLPVLVAAEAIATGRVAELAWNPERFAGLPRVTGPSGILPRLIDANLMLDRILSR